MKGKSIYSFIALFFILIFFNSGYAQTTAFNYQGKLSDGALAANGTYQFEFKLYDSAAGGSQIGQTIADLPASVTKGIFAVTLDFGAGGFDGAARYLEISVRQLGSGQSYTKLTPRQPITSTPYAVKSLNAVKAETADVSADALRLGSLPADQYVQTVDGRLSDDRNPLPGSQNYIQNATVSQADASFNIAGEGKANVLTAAQQFNLGANRILTATAQNNLLVGAGTGAGLTTGYQNSFFGQNSGAKTTTGFDNSFFGNFSGNNNAGGNANSFFGAGAGVNNSSGGSNSFFGMEAGIGNTSGSGNTFVGRLAGFSNTTENDNTFIGYRANGAAAITNATAIGANAVVTTSNTMVLGTGAVAVKVPGSLNVAGTFSADVLDATSFYKINNNRVLHTTGTDNTFVGLESGAAIGSGGFNAFFGANAGKNNTTGLNNTFVGAYAGRGNVAGTNNAFFGANAGLGNNANFNSFFGSNAGSTNINGTGNSFFGTSSGWNNTGGNNNSFFGYKSGEVITGGSNNTFVGALSGAIAGAENISNNTAIGYNVKFGAGVANSVGIGANVSVTTSNTVKIGGSTVELGGELKVGKVTASFGTSVFPKILTDEVATEKLTVNDELFTRELTFQFNGVDANAALLPLCYAQIGFSYKPAPCPPNFQNASRSTPATDDAVADSMKQQQAQIEKLEEQIKRQNAQIGLLKALVCAQNREAAVCSAENPTETKKQ